MSIPDWFPKHPPIYDIQKTYVQNAQEGPFFDAAIPRRPQQKCSLDFLGCTLASPLGIPAGPLLNSSWIALAAKLGFDLVTYKTIRSFAHPSHALPNMIFVEPDINNIARMRNEPQEMEDLTLTNSFGMPSPSPDFLLEDIDKANRSLSGTQAMIVSVVGTPNQGVSFADDFVRAALIAKEAGAKLIEANFSCPNVGKAEGALYTNPDAMYTFSRAIVRAVHPIPLILKVGVFPSLAIMADAFESAAKAGVRAICGINSVSMSVVDDQKNSPLGPTRSTSGVCGAAIFPKALEFVRTGTQVIRKGKLDLELLGCGGVVKAEQFDELLKCGAKIAMSATGMMWDPFLALRYHWNQHDKKKSHLVPL